MNCRHVTLNITMGTDVVLNDHLVFDDETFDPALSVDITANLVNSIGKRTPLEVEAADGILIISIPWADGRNAGFYGLEVTGKCNGKKWATYADSLIHYTRATVPGASEVEVESDYYDVTQVVAFRYSTSPINEVYADVDNSVGEPYANCDYNGSELSLEFRNIKGNGLASMDVIEESSEDEGVNHYRLTDELGNTLDMNIRNGSQGKDGEKGEKGDQGDSAIFTGEGVPWSGLKNTTGQSTTEPMSQKAITDSISYYDNVDLSSPPLTEIKQVIKSDGTWTNAPTSSTKYRAVFLPVSPGEVFRITPNANGDAIFAFLTSTSHTAGATAPFTAGVTGRTTISITSVVTAPASSQYLYLFKSTDVGLDRLPTVERVSNVKDRLASLEGSVANDISELQTQDQAIEELLHVKERLALSASTGGIVGSNGTWTGVPNANWKHAVVTIEAGKHYRIESELATSIYVLRSYTKPTTDGGTPDFSHDDGFDERIMIDASPYVYEFDAPSDAAKLVVCTQRRDDYVNYQTNTQVYEVSNVNQAIQDIISADQKQIKMLVIGDSWGRDIATEIQPAAADMGINLYVAQAYQGGSGLYNQYKGMDDPARHYTHGSYEQYVQGTYQLWTYTSDTPIKTPSTGYNNGKCGVDDGTAYGKVSANGAWFGKTLAEILASQDWDIILIRLHCGELQNPNSLMAEEESEANKFFDINDFIDAMEDELTETCLAKVKWGVATTWAWPEEAALTYTPVATALAGLGISNWAALTNAEKQAVFAQLYPNIQENFQKVCKHIGNRLSYAVNIAKAFNDARQSEWLGNIGFHLNRANNDMHLSNGIPKYLCALTILYSIFDKGRNALQLKYVPDLSDGSGTDSDGGSDDSAVTPTKALCVGAQAIAWKAACNTI